MRSNGLSPTKAPSMNTCAEVGVERRSSLQGLLPARCSRALRFTTSGGGPEGDATCCGLSAPGLAAVAGPLGLDWFGWLAAVAEAAEVPPAYSAVSCAYDTAQKDRASRQAGSKISGSRRNRLRGSKNIFIGLDRRSSFSSDVTASRSNTKLEPDSQFWRLQVHWAQSGAQNCVGIAT